MMQQVLDVRALFSISEESECPAVSDPTMPLKNLVWLIVPPRFKMLILYPGP